MKPVIAVYCEGNDTKIAVVQKEKDKLRVIRLAAVDVFQPALDMEEGISNLNIEGEDIGFEGVEKEAAASASTQSLLSSELRGLNLSKSFFLPALTEPAIYYHVFEGAKQTKSAKLTQEIITDIQETKNVTIDKENLGYIELADNSILSVFLSGEVHCINQINALARYHGRRYYKIPSVKSSEISLAYYVAKRKKFFPDDNSLIVYIGKEYSKLIFLHGRKLKHIGSTLDIGTINLHTYDVYFSKILLEMENGGITSLDNIIVCGEDDSENLILSFYGTFPEANVSRLEFDDLNLEAVKDEKKDSVSSFSVPLAVAVDYFDELNEEHKGINLLPKYVRETQKIFQFAWHGYLMIPLLFLAAMFITQQILSNSQKLNELTTEIEQKTFVVRQNQEMLTSISNIEAKISGFDQTQAILDSASVGTDIWTDILAQLSGFFAARKNIWLTKLTTEDNNQVILEGYAINKQVLTDFAYFLRSAELKGVFFEEIREKSSYKFTITFNLSGYISKTE